MSKFLVFGLFIYLFGVSLLSKPNDNGFKDNAVFIELVGQTVGFFSINVDYRYNPNFSFRIGFGLSLGYTIPISLNYISHENLSHHFEFGLGLTYGKFATINIFGGSSEPVDALIPTAFIGYRYQPKKGGLFFRVGFTPWFRINKSTNFDREGGYTTKYNIEFIPVGGISLGYCF